MSDCWESKIDPNFLVTAAGLVEVTFEVMAAGGGAIGEQGRKVLAVGWGEAEVSFELMSPK